MKALLAGKPVDKLQVDDCCFPPGLSKDVVLGNVQKMLLSDKFDARAGKRPTLQEAMDISRNLLIGMSSALAVAAIPAPVAVAAVQPAAPVTARASSGSTRDLLASINSEPKPAVDDLSILKGASSSTLVRLKKLKLKHQS